MKNAVKKLVVVMTLVFSIGVSAQDRKERIKDATPEERVEMRTEKLSEKLGLDENQKAKVKEFLLSQKKENKEVREEMKADREKARAEMKATMKKQHEELKAKLKPILTEDQYKKWEAMQNENIEKVKERKKHKKQ